MAEFGVPQRASDDPEVLASWYFGADTLFGFYRKVMLAGCKEAIRATKAAIGQRVTNDQLDDLAHQHPAYLKFLEEHLEGRTQWLHYYLKNKGMS